jgi:hypothetical protein
MRRIQLIEIHDQAWFPASLRDQVTDDLQVLLNIGKPYEAILPQLGEGIERAGADCVLDLCSGAGGPWPWLVDAIEREERQQIQVQLSDKYPNTSALERAKTNSANLRYHSDPVDATRVPRELPGFRTLFTSFHHFPAPQAREILRDAVASGRGIGVFEIPGRRPLTLLLLPLVLIADILLVPFLSPFSLKRLVWRWLIPIIPLVLLFDGIVSCLRAYSPGELRGLVANLSAAEYTWKIGCQKGSLLSLPITYLIGYPQSVAAHREPFEASSELRRSPARRTATKGRTSLPR